MTDRLLMEDLEVRIGNKLLVNGVSLTLSAGRVTALVGASGSGKTLLARSFLGLVDLVPGVVKANYRVEVGAETWQPYEGILGAGIRSREAAFTPIRGDIVGYLPQNARAALDPLWTVRDHVQAAAKAAGLPSAAEGWLQRAGIKDVDRVAGLFPHELSGGMAQRVGIAQSLARQSRFLLADEPTTGLDPTVQTAILDAIRALAADGIGVLLITHDLRIVPDLADDVVLMEEGRVAETPEIDALRAGKLQSEAGQRMIRATQLIAAGRLG